MPMGERIENRPLTVDRADFVEQEVRASSLLGMVFDSGPVAPPDRPGRDGSAPPALAERNVEEARVDFAGDAAGETIDREMGDWGVARCRALPREVGGESCRGSEDGSRPRRMGAE